MGVERYDDKLTELRVQDLLYKIKEELERLKDRVKRLEGKADDY